MMPTRAIASSRPTRTRQGSPGCAGTQPVGGRENPREGLKGAEMRTAFEGLGKDARREVESVLEGASGSRMWLRGSRRRRSTA